MFARIHGAFEWLLETIGIVLLVGLSVIVLLAVLARGLDISMGWYDEVASIALAWLTYYGAALAALKRGHMGFSGLFLAMAVRWRAISFFVCEALIIGFFGLLAWKGYEVLEVMEGSTLISLPWVPVALAQSIIPVGATLFIAAEILSIPEAWRRAFSGTDVEAEEIERAIQDAARRSEDTP